MSVSLCVAIALAVVPGNAAAATEPGLSKALAHDLVTQYLSERATRVTQDAGIRSGQSLAVIPMTETLTRRLDTEAQTLAGVRSQTEKAAFGGYEKADVAVTIGSVSGSATDAVVGASELTKLYFGHDDPNAPGFEGYRLDHQFTFVDRNGAWTLADTTVELGSGPAPAPQFGANSVKQLPVADGSSGSVHLQGKLLEAGTIPAQAAGADAGAVDKLSSSGSATAAYDYQAMYNYAAQYWDNYNSAYRSFGNDCTNFISQILAAGGWAYDFGDYSDDSNWWYNALNQTYSWAGAHNWAVFAQVISKRTRGLPQVNQLLTTDILQVDWDHPDEVPGEAAGNIDHTMVVTGYQGTAGSASEVYLTYHTTDRWNVPFWGWLLAQTEARDAWYAHRT